VNLYDKTIIDNKQLKVYDELSLLYSGGL